MKKKTSQMHVSFVPINTFIADYRVHSLIGLNASRVNSKNRNGLKFSKKSNQH